MSKQPNTTRIYIVQHEGDQPTRLVEASSQAQAKSVILQGWVARPATPKEIAAAFAKNPQTEIEQAGGE